MKIAPRKQLPTSQKLRCAIYTRKSTEEGLQQEFNSLDAQRESGEAYITSQAHEGWECLPDHYDDGGYTGGNMDRPALQRLLADIGADKIDIVVVYKVDRLSRSLLDFAKMVETFDKHHVSFVSVTQLINTATSMGRLMLNVLLSFAQFEREIISERTRDKIAAARRKGKWSGGLPLLGYNVVNTKLVVDPDEAEQVRQIFTLYLASDGLIPVVKELNRRGWRTKCWTTKKGVSRGGRPFDKNSLWQLLTNATYVGKVRYKDEVHEGEHEAIVSNELWQQVQSKLQRNGRTGGGDVRNKFGALLKGLLHCAACGCAMAPSHTTRGGNKRYRYYVCIRAQKLGWESCPSKSVPAGEIERFVIEQIKRVGQDPLVLRETIAQVHKQAESRLAEMALETRGLERDLSRWNRDVHQLSGQVGSTIEGPATARLADLQERIGAGERRLTELRQEAAAIESSQISECEIAKALASFDAIWQALTPREQARILELLIERVDFDGASGRLAITFHPTGIKTLAAQSVDREDAA